MVDRTEQQVVIVTGAARGIGRAVVERLHRDGYAVAAADIDAEAVRGVAAALDPAGKTARGYALDVSDAAAVTRVFAKTAGDFGVPTALVNCAGIYPDHAL